MSEKKKDVDDKNYKPEREDNDEGVKKTHEQINDMFNDGAVDQKEKNKKRSDEE